MRLECRARLPLLRHWLASGRCPGAPHELRLAPRKLPSPCPALPPSPLLSPQAFNLKNADLTCANMRELTVYNIR